ncbi:MAG: hypothetical protein PHW13_09665 [Methylococcales bacterium]|nr:hypothetical protein [Methylococcales bacterium]
MTANKYQLGVYFQRWAVFLAIGEIPETPGDRPETQIWFFGLGRPGTFALAGELMKSPIQVGDFNQEGL